MNPVICLLLSHLQHLAALNGRECHSDIITAVNLQYSSHYYSLLNISDGQSKAAAI